MIKSFKCKETEKIFKGRFSKKFPPEIQTRALIKLHMVDAAKFVVDLRVPPANFLEQLQGDRLGQYSIRINQQYRVCFIWEDNNAFNVEIVDYH
mgnify:CR=1 FL=1